MREYISYIKLEAKYIYDSKIVVCTPNNETRGALFDMLVEEFDTIERTVKNIGLIELKNGTTIKIISDANQGKGISANILVFPYDRKSYDQSFLYTIFPIVQDECHRRIIGLI